MEPVNVIAGPVSVLDRDDVDTDQIIPKQFLKRIERSGFGEFLFYDWAQRVRAGTCPPTRSSSRGATSAAAPRASTRRGRSRTTASRRSSRRRSPTSSRSNSTKIGLLPGRARRGRVPARSPPPAAPRSTSPRRRSATATGRSRASRSTPEIKHRLLGGLDDIALTLQQGDAIAAYESDRERSGPVTTALCTRARQVMRLSWRVGAQLTFRSVRQRRHPAAEGQERPAHRSGATQ